jgi:hypothetical protein
MGMIARLGAAKVAVEARWHGMAGRRSERASVVRYCCSRQQAVHAEPQAESVILSQSVHQLLGSRILRSLSPANGRGAFFTHREDNGAGVLFAAADDDAMCLVRRDGCAGVKPSMRKKN